MKNALIVFPDEWLQYAPTILNLERCLRDWGHETYVLYGDNGQFQNDGLVENGKRIALTSGSLRAWVLRKLKLYRAYKYCRVAADIYKLQRRRPEFDLVVAVDSMGYLAARRRFDRVVFLSLEVNRDHYLRKCRSLGIADLIIQSRERAEYLLGGIGCNDVTVHYLANAPILDEDSPRSVSSSRKRILYLGNINRGYAIRELLESFRSLPRTYTITLKGFGTNEQYVGQLTATYADLIRANRLDICSSYTEQKDLQGFVSRYGIGVVGYDQELIDEDFNYASSPSGKLFNYYAAGIPVIGVVTPGLKSVTDFRAGVLLKEFNAQSLLDAVEKIEVDYEQYARNSYEAAKHFDFKVGFKQFIEAYYRS